MEDTTKAGVKFRLSHPEQEEEDDGIFRTLVVMQFSAKVPHGAIEWILHKVSSPRSKGGGELKVASDTDDDKAEKMIYISATTERLLIAAELMEIKKPCRDGSLREISMADLDEFENSEDLDHLLTLAEKQRIVLHELESIRALETDHCVPEVPKVKLHTSEAIIAKCTRQNIIQKLFPLHDKMELKRLGKEWYQNPMAVQPLEDIHRYFGETVAMYFAFLGFYTMALIPPTVIGVLSVISPQENVNMQVFFSIFNIVWTTLFLEVWKRNCSTLAYKWGTIDTEHFEEARSEYYGTLDVNKVTGRLEPKYPKWKRKLKFYAVSLPVVMVCLVIAFFVMLGYFWLQVRADRFYVKNQNILGMCVVYMPSAIYAVVISIMNAVYRKLAKELNDWENHRLQSAYDNHLITKLVLFDFTNCFMSLFYVAFYMQDMQLLRSHLATLLIVQQIIGQVREAIIPYLMYKRRKLEIETKHGRRSKTPDSVGMEPLVVGGGITDESKLQAEIESSKDEYEGTLDDYLEMFLQFGYVFLFSSVFPSAAFWALMNNITEIRSDAFKLCHIFQRPFSKPTASIGAWQLAFESMSVMAVVTNCALVGLSPQVQEYVPEYGAINVLLLFVIVEHILLFIKVMLAYLIPDAPDWVETALARLDYQSKLAWRNQRNIEAKKHYKRKTSRVQAPALEDLEFDKETSGAEVVT